MLLAHRFTLVLFALELQGLEENNCFVTQNVYFIFMVSCIVTLY